MGRKAVDLNVGARFGMLKVIKRHSDLPRTENRRGVHQYLCRCDCGKPAIVRKINLTSGNSQSCGCQKGRKRLLWRMAA